MNTDHVESALRMFSAGSACSQAILATFSPLVGVDSGLANKMSAGLGAGFGRKQYLCGAISAGSIILSLKYGSEDPSDVEAKGRASAAVNTFITAMENELGASSCLDLLGVPITTPQERQEAQQKGVFQALCPKYVRAVAEYLTRELEG